MKSQLTSVREFSEFPEEYILEIGRPSYPNPPSSDLALRDSGPKAWLFLFGASIVEITTWGWSFCYGVFYQYFYEHEPFQGQSLVSIGGMLASGCLQLSLPLIIFLLNNYPAQRERTMWAGCFICGGSLIAGAFMTNAAGLVIFLGPVYGLGGGMVFASVAHYLGHWFDKRKSLAYGIITGAGAAGGAALPPLYTVLLNRFGHKPTLISIGIGTTLITGLGIVFIGPRTHTEVTLKQGPKDFKFFVQPLFLIFLAATFIQALAHFAPSVYLPLIGRDIGLSTTQGSLLVSVLNLAQAIGQPMCGIIADYYASVWIPFFLCTAGGGLSALLIWPFARGLWSLMLFSVAFGLTACGFAVLRPRFASTVLYDAIYSPSDENTPNAQEIRAGQNTFIFSVLTATRGVSVIASGFITAVLVNMKTNDIQGYGLGSKWRVMMIFTGVTMLSSSLGVFGKLLQVRNNNKKPYRIAANIGGNHEGVDKKRRIVGI